MDGWFFFSCREDLFKYKLATMCVCGQMVNLKVGVIYKPFSEYTGKKYAKVSKN